VTPSRVLVFAMPRLLHDILDRLLTAATDVEVVDPRAGEDLVDAAVRTQADVVIAPETSVRQEAVCRLFASRARTRLLAISADGRRGDLYELCPQRRAIAELTADAILDSIRPREC
jgi:hypothetical protein